MPLRVPALMLLVGSFMLPVVAQQKPGNPWDVVGGYVCSQSSENPTSEKLYLLPDMTWSRNPPFTSFASREHLNYSASFGHPENLPDWMQVAVYITRKKHRYKTLVDSGWRPRVFRYEGDTLRLYTVEKPLPRTLLRVGQPEMPELLLLFREFRVDPVSQELRQILAGKDPPKLLVCRKNSLF